MAGGVLKSTPAGQGRPPKYTGSITPDAGGNAVPFVNQSIQTTAGHVPVANDPVTYTVSNGFATNIVDTAR